MEDLHRWLEDQKQLARVCEQVQQLMVEHELRGKRLAGRAAEQQALMRQRIALEAIRSKCDELQPPTKRGPRSPAIERIRSLAEMGLSEEGT